MHTQIHATCVELSGAGILLLGPSGAGKSDLALRLIDSGGRLVADDRTDLERVNDELYAHAPATIAGQLEVRGLGIYRMPSVSRARVRLAVDLVARDAVERLPEPATRAFLGLNMRLIALDPFATSAVAKLRVAIGALGA